MGLPALAVLYLPLLVGEASQHWQDAPIAYLAAQVEQETCISLKHPKCWNPRAELKTPIEYGFGLGQLTVTKKFDNFKAAKTWDASLAKWRWEDRYDPQMQLRALVIYDRNLSRQVSFAADPHERAAFMFSAYNGGYGGVLKDRALCRSTAGCDQGRWFGHVERQSFRAKTAVKGYGQSFYEINRGYVRNIMTVRAAKYEEALSKGAKQK